jgi:hypothetical protein
LKERTQIQLKYVASHLLLVPVLLLISCLAGGEKLAVLCIAQTILVILFFAGYWEFQGIWFKWVYGISMELILLSMLVVNLLPETFSPANLYLLLFLSLFQVYLLLILTKILIVVFRSENESVEIVFPLKNGTYLITDGGNSKISRLMNYHFYSSVHRKKGTNKSMQFATDIVKISKNVRPFFPLQNKEYPIFDEQLFAPMEGVVLKVVNDIPDNLPFSGNYPYNTGNTIVIKNGRYYFLLGHLKKGSIAVKEGDFVKQNEFIGHAGNSGMSERPHLHMQLMKCETDDYWKGRGICIRFDGKNLYKNRLITILQQLGSNN